MPALNKLHNLSLRLLTLCGIGAVISLAVNILTAVLLFVTELCQKQTDEQ